MGFNLIQGRDEFWEVVEGERESGFGWVGGVITGVRDRLGRDWWMGRGGGDQEKDNGVFKGRSRTCVVPRGPVPYEKDEERVSRKNR